MLTCVICLQVAFSVPSCRAGGFLLPPPPPRLLIFPSPSLSPSHFLLSAVSPWFALPTWRPFFSRSRFFCSPLPKNRRYAGYFFWELQKMSKSKHCEHCLTLCASIRSRAEFYASISKIWKTICYDPQSKNKPDEHFCSLVNCKLWQVYT